MNARPRHLHALPPAPAGARQSSSSRPITSSGETQLAGLLRERLRHHAAERGVPCPRARITVHGRSVLRAQLLFESVDGAFRAGPRLEFSVSDAAITGALLDVFAQALLDRCPLPHST
ncbi:hypothetical protein [Mameliella alba]|uniref:hypothetical protein n=1 Tax=Mameliella alba TaxID=561184 RepID=UPI000891C153|nr:hypothetical protein [Mameliella alba]OWV45629.1 hypothetical protein CDZ95_01330 [Mameliella alba]OWV49442.1 hypothetical protein CDZ96_03390 [Mameliella alba]OWV65629.1 hypothetical protein CDZ97_07025 [Mameliella alba]PTR41408.1 hypothetical protein LX94_00692 [Mameliella alba]SDC43282.1 hypothetical protein SAMN05216376_102438 [Mameliella alba]